MKSSSSKQLLPTTKIRALVTDKGKESRRFVSNFWIGYYSQNRNNINEATIINRQLWLKQYAFHQLNLARKVHLDGDSFLYPLVSPLVHHTGRLSTYKRRYKIIQFYDYCEFNSPGDIVKLDETSITNPLYLFTYADLLDMSECLLSLRAKLPTIVFVPYTKAKMFVAKLSKVQSSAIKAAKTSSSKISVHSILMSSMKVVQKELQIPICIFNPPPKGED